MNWWKVAFIALIFIGACVGCFFWGRSTIETPAPEIKYVKGDKVYVNVDNPVPVEVIKPCDTLNVIRVCVESGKYKELFPEVIRDSIIYITKDDSSRVIKDWATERIYEEKVIENDTIGSVTVRAKTQYNRLTWLGTDYTPITKTIIKPQPVKTCSPFIGVGLTSYPAVLGQVGVFFQEKYGVSCLYQYGWEAENKKHIWGCNFIYKF